MRGFNGFSEFDAIVYAAAMLLGSESPLGGIFTKVIGGETDLLPKVETLIYEDKQGLSGWIGEKKVLLGGRQMMNNHNIEVLTGDKEKQYINSNPDRRILYLAVAGTVAAMFLVSYKLDKGTARDLNFLSRHCYTLLLHSTDQNINESFTEHQLGLRGGSVKVISPDAANYFKLCRTEAIPDAGTCPFTAGKGLRAVLRLQVTAVKLQNAFQLIRTLNLACLALGALLIAALFLFGSASTVSGFFLFLLQALWTGVCIGVCKFAENR